MSNPVVLQGLLDNKREYTDHLSDVLCETLLQEFADGYDRLRQNPARRGNVLNLFQSWLAEIPEWNAARVKALFQSVRERSGCGYIGDLVKGILVTCVKIQVVSHGSPNEDSRKIKLRVPSAENFTHACAIAAARSFWKRPYLFYHDVRSLERQHNLVQAEALIKTALKNTLRSYLPMDQLMRVMPAAGGDMPPDPVISESEESSGDDESEEASDGDGESDSEEASADGGYDDGDDGDDDGESESDNARDSYMDVAKAPMPPVAPEPESEPESDSESEPEPESEPVVAAPAPALEPVAAVAAAPATEESDYESDYESEPEPQAAFAPEPLREPESDADSVSEDIAEAHAPFAAFDDSADSMNMSDIERIVDAPDADADGDEESEGETEAATVKNLSIDSDHDSDFTLQKEPESAAAAAQEQRTEREPRPSADVRVIPLPNMLINRARMHKVRLDKTRVVRPALSATATRRAEGAFF